MKAPFPYFGGKSSVADIVWRALGQPKHYIEPFFGSGAVLLNRPAYVAGEHAETVCDKDGYLANVWRSLQYQPDEVAKWCDWPVNHADLSARKKALLRNGDGLLSKLIADETYCDPLMAGYWVWGASCWIGRGLTYIGQRPHISGTGIGVHAIGQIPHISDTGRGVQEPYNTTIYAWFRSLSERLRYVRVVCGDWTRVCGGGWQNKMGVVGMFFDPPYGVDDRNTSLYHCESLTVASDVREWAKARGEMDSYRIVIAGYFDEHESLLADGWTCHRWSAFGGMSNIARNKDKANNNRHREALFFSPHCLVHEPQCELSL